MTLNALQALTWSTITGAVVGALLLASVETDFSEKSGVRRTDASPKSSPTEASARRSSSEREPPLIETSARRELAVR